MTVDELIDKILTAYPGASPEAMATFKPVFHARFDQREGPHLEAAFTATLAEFKAGARQPFPIPADIEAHMPSLDRQSAPKLDLKAHAERKRKLLEEWRRAQGFRGSQGISQVMQALEFIAEPIAQVRAWSATPEPIRLTKADLVLAQQRAVSAERRKQHGPPTRDTEAWWQQVEAIQRAWKIPLTREEWTAKDEKRKAA